MADSEQESIDFVWNTVDRIRTGMLTTLCGPCMRSRPMTAIPRREENRIWFFADRSPDSENDIRVDPRACLSFSDPKDQTYISLSGKLALNSDPGLKKDLWSLGADVYFPAGPEDDKVVLIGFEPEHAEYWDSPANPLVLAVKFVQAKLTGERPNLGENTKLQLS